MSELTHFDEQGAGRMVEGGNGGSFKCRILGRGDGMEPSRWQKR